MQVPYRREGIRLSGRKATPLTTDCRCRVSFPKRFPPAAGRLRMTGANERWGGGRIPLFFVIPSPPRDLLAPPPAVAFLFGFFSRQALVPPPLPFLRGARGPFQTALVFPNSREAASENFFSLVLPAGKATIAGQQRSTVQGGHISTCQRVVHTQPLYGFSFVTIPAGGTPRRVSTI